MDKTNNHIFQLLRAFSRDEIRKFKSFLDSPYFNSNKNVKVLFNKIIKYYPAFQHKNLHKENLFKTIYGSDTKNISNLRYLYSELLHQALEFLKIENFYKDGVAPDILLLNALNKKRNSNLFSLTLKKIGKYSKNSSEITENRTIDGSYFNFLYQLENEKYNYVKINEKVIKSITPFEHSSMIVNSDRYLTMFFITEIICDYINLKIHSIKYNMEISETYTKNLLEGICLYKIKDALGKDFKYNHIIELYIALFETFENMGDEKYYFSYKELIDKNIKILNREEISFHYSKLINYLILKDIKYSQANEIAEELFKIYKVFLEKELYKNNKIDYLPESLYRAILFLGLRLKELDWVKIFIEKYTPLIHTKDKGNLNIFGFSFYYFAKGDFEKSLEYSNKINFDYFIFKFDVKVLILKIYFELSYFEDALTVIHSFKELLRTDNFLNRETKEYYNNFIKFLKELILMKTSGKSEPDFTNYKVMNTEKVLNKEWLIQKCKEMQKAGKNISTKNNKKITLQ